MAYEQFYMGYLLICYILTDLWYHYGQSDFLDLKDRVGIFVKNAFQIY